MKNKKIISMALTAMIFISACAGHGRATEKNMEIGAIAGAAAGAVVIIGGVIYTLYKLNKEKKEEQAIRNNIFDTLQNSNANNAWKLKIEYGYGHEPKAFFAQSGHNNKLSLKINTLSDRVVKCVTTIDSILEKCDYKFNINLLDKNTLKRIKYGPYEHIYDVDLKCCDTSNVKTDLLQPLKDKLTTIRTNNRGAFDMLYSSEALYDIQEVLDGINQNFDQDKKDDITKEYFKLRAKLYKSINNLFCDQQVQVAACYKKYYNNLRLYYEDNLIDNDDLDNSLLQYCDKLKELLNGISKKINTFNYYDIKNINTTITFIIDEIAKLRKKSGSESDKIKKGYLEKLKKLREIAKIADFYPCHDGAENNLYVELSKIKRYKEDNGFTQKWFEYFKAEIEKEEVSCRDIMRALKAFKIFSEHQPNYDDDFNYCII